MWFLIFYLYNNFSQQIGAPAILKSGAVRQHIDLTRVPRSRHEEPSFNAKRQNTIGMGNNNYGGSGLHNSKDNLGGSSKNVTINQNHIYISQMNV